MKKIIAMKSCGAGNFSVTRYHIADALVDRAVDGEQVINSKCLCLHMSFFTLHRLSGYQLLYFLEPVEGYELV